MQIVAPAVRFVPDSRRFDRSPCMAPRSSIPAKTKKNGQNGHLGRLSCLRYNGSSQANKQYAAFPYLEGSLPRLVQKTGFSALPTYIGVHGPVETAFDIQQEAHEIEN